MDEMKQIAVLPHCGHRIATDLKLCLIHLQWADIAAHCGPQERGWGVIRIARAAEFEYALGILRAIGCEVVEHYKPAALES